VREALLATGIAGSLARALGELGSDRVYMAPEARELVDSSRGVGAPGEVAP